MIIDYKCTTSVELTRLRVKFERVRWNESPCVRSLHVTLQRPMPRPML